ncbi:MAG: helix-turn-helix transcriptional regulator [Gammaproteobacteria bacterium]|nr:helix-turn-helix transcriptional regulator [Gammaproteobacteria bacterium]MDH5800041.1 helix-turn-helix transcriptional regulator [Gammaproteobacteria bacterium]
MTDSDFKQTPGFDYFELVKLADCTEQLRHTRSEQQLVACLQENLLSVIPVECGSVFVVDETTGDISYTVKIAPKAIFGENNSDLPRYELQRCLYGSWYSKRAFYCERIDVFHARLNLSSVKYTNGLYVVDAVSGKDGKICLYALVCADKIVADLCRELMRIILPAVCESIRRVVRVESSGVESLTDRELDILTRICQGYDNKSIALQLSVSINTVKSHIYNAYRKLQVNNRVEALIALEKSGVLL